MISSILVPLAPAVTTVTTVEGAVVDVSNPPRAIDPTFGVAEYVGAEAI